MTAPRARIPRPPVVVRPSFVSQDSLPAVPGLRTQTVDDLLDGIVVRVIEALERRPDLVMRLRTVVRGDTKAEPLAMPPRFGRQPRSRRALRVRRDRRPPPSPQAATAPLRLPDPRRRRPRPDRPGVFPRVRLLWELHTPLRIRGARGLFAYLARTRRDPPALTDGFYVRVGVALSGRLVQPKILHSFLSPPPAPSRSWTSAPERGR
jgi:hypothetical protein